MTGDEQVTAYLGAVPGRVYQNILATITRLGFDLKTLIVDKKLSGDVLKRQSGTLAGAQNLNVLEDGGTNVTAQVGFNKATAPWGVWHERGVNHSWLIEAKRAKMLRFMWHGAITFRRSVVHPPLPERSFMRSALAEIAPRVRPELEAAVAEGLKP